MVNPNKELIEKLEAEQKNLLNRLKAVRNAIIGFGGEISNLDFSDILQVEEEEQIIYKPLMVPQEFSKDLQQIQKIAYVIKDLGGEAYVSEIVDRLLELEGNKDISESAKVTFRRNITLLTSYLYRDNRLKVKKDGIKYRYSLIE